LDFDFLRLGTAIGNSSRFPIEKLGEATSLQQLNKLATGVYYTDDYWLCQAK